MEELLVHNLELRHLQNQLPSPTCGNVGVVISVHMCMQNPMFTITIENFDYYYHNNNADDNNSQTIVTIARH